MPTQHSYSVPSSPVVMDVSLWPGGYSFAGADGWWQHTLAQNEHERLDNLMGLALLDPTVHDRLIVQHDPALLDGFDLSADTRYWLSSIKANTLKEFAQAIIAASNPMRAWSASEAA
ncbi:MAG: hypothetical protein ACYDBJ_17875 [Aggregatilineales bacterium]